MFITFGVVACAIAFHGLRMLRIDPAWGRVLLTSGIAAAVVSGVVSRLPHTVRINVWLMVVTFVSGAYGFNLLLAYSKPAHVAEGERIAAKRAATAGFDTRSVREVVHAMRADGRATVPALYTFNALEDGDRDRRFLPLAGLPDAETVLCNENGVHAVFRADKRGFNNPEALAQADILLIGDSYTQGQCVPQDKTLAGIMRKRGYRVYSLGVSGNGPLATLAALTEYGLAMKPKVVVWGHSGDDRAAVSSEMLDPILVRYLNEDGFRQNLADRRDEVDAYWNDLLDRQAYYDPSAAAPTETWRKDPTLKELATLFTLRTMLGLGRNKRGSSKDTYQRVITTAKRRVQAAGGTLVMTSYPYFEDIEAGPTKRDIFAELDRTGAVVIDIDDAFHDHPDPPSLFPLRDSGHYSEAGYEVAADVLIERAIDPYLP